MVSPSGAKLEEGWCEMATAKPKRMMVGGMAAGAVKNLMGPKKAQAPSTQSQMQEGAARGLKKASLTNKPDPRGSMKIRPVAPGALEAYMARRAVPNPKVMQGNLNARDFRNATMKKGGAVKKATKK